MIRWSAWLVSLALLPFPASAALSPTGAWFGTGQRDDKVAMYLEWIRRDGGIRVHHRTCIKGKTSEQWEEGRWSVSGDILTVRLHTTNGRKTSTVFTYRILSLDHQHHRYVSLPDNFTFNARKVQESFEMPSCELVS
jgi:hypothetical protein